MRAAEQQIMSLLCAGVYEADHYRGFMVYIGATSPRHVWCSKPFVVLFAVTRTLTMEHEVVWLAIPYLILPIARIRGMELSR